MAFTVPPKYIIEPIFCSRGFLLCVGDSKCFYAKYGGIRVGTDGIFDKRPFFRILKDDIFTNLVL